MLVLIDEYKRKCMAIRIARRSSSFDVIEALAVVMLWREFRTTFDGRKTEFI